MARSTINWPAILPPTIMAAISVVSAIVTIATVTAQLRASDEAQGARLERVETSVDKMTDRLSDILQRLVRVETRQETQGQAGTQGGNRLQR
jgi:hypothetical protein